MRVPHRPASGASPVLMAAAMSCGPIAVSALTGRTAECGAIWLAHHKRALGYASLADRMVSAHLNEPTTPISQQDRTSLVEMERASVLNALGSLGFRTVRSALALRSSGHERREVIRPNGESALAWQCPSIFRWYLDGLTQLQRNRGRYLLALPSHWAVLDRGRLFDPSCPNGAWIHETGVRHLAVVSAWRVWRVATPEASALRHSTVEPEPGPAGTPAPEATS